MSNQRSGLHNAFEVRLNNMDNDLIALLNKLESYSDTSLNKKPDAESWSVLQILHHLIRSEGLSKKYVEKKLSFKPKLNRPGLSNIFRNFLLKSYLNVPIKFKAPKGVSTPHLPESSDIKSTKDIWLNQRKELRQYLKTIPSEMIGKEIYKHPIAGRLTLPQMLDFFQTHYERHKKQLEKTLEITSQRSA
ncbi:MAG: DinB family protein [Bacteroidetes bacterium]|nr:DinB family protein [Bacteroidota bacterium]